VRQFRGRFLELGAGTSATELGRKHGVHAITISAWRSKYASLEAI